MSLKVTTDLPKYSYGMSGGKYGVYLLPIITIIIGKIMNKNDKNPNDPSAKSDEEISHPKEINIDKPFKMADDGSDFIKDTKNVPITSFTPDTIAVGTIETIDCQVAGGLPVPPESLRPVNGTFTNTDTGEVFQADTVMIMDSEKYTIMYIVTSGLLVGNYTIEILLEPSGQHHVDSYRLTSTAHLQVKPEPSIKITKITPNIVSAAELKLRTFTISGFRLNQIRISSGFYLQTANERFQVLGPLGSESVQVRYASDTIPEPGYYKVNAKHNQGGAPVFSQARLTITESKIEEPK